MIARCPSGAGSGSSGEEWCSGHRWARGGRSAAGPRGRAVFWPLTGLRVDRSGLGEILMGSEKRFGERDDSCGADGSGVAGAAGRPPSRQRGASGCAEKQPFGR